MRSVLCACAKGSFLRERDEQLEASPLQSRLYELLFLKDVAMAVQSQRKVARLRALIFK